MQLTELSEGDELLIKSCYFDKKAYGDTEVNFHTTVTDVLKMGILTDQMRSEEGNPINFESSIVCSDTYFIREGEAPIVWHNIFIRRLKSRKQKVHAIVSRLNGIKFNRRSSYRVFVGVHSVARLGVGRKATDVVVKDISATGFAIVTQADDEVRQLDYVRTTLDDFGYHLALEGVCVRRQLLDSGRVVYGIQMGNKDPMLEEHLTVKQRYMAKNRK